MVIPAQITQTAKAVENTFKAADKKGTKENVKPLKANKYEAKRFTAPCRVQPKLNGIRALSQHGEFYSGDELKWHPSVLEHLSRRLRQLFPPDLILDGELYVHGWSLQEINSAVAVKRTAPTDRTPFVQYHIFDRVDPAQSFLGRYFPVLEYLNAEGDPFIRPVTTVAINSTREGDQQYSRFVQLGYEGAMYRFGSCPYTFPGQGSDKQNRVWHMLKRKDWQDDEFRIIGVVEGEGKHAGRLGAFVCETPTGRQFNVGSGPTDIERERWWHNPPIGKLATVKYLILSDEGIPLNPTLLLVHE